MTHPHLSPASESADQSATYAAFRDNIAEHFYRVVHGTDGVFISRCGNLKIERNSHGIVLSDSAAKLLLELLGDAQTRQEPVEWHWRVLEDNGHPASKWFVVDGDVEEFKRDMASDPYEIRPLYTAPVQWMQVPKPWAYYVEHKMFGVELSLDQPSEDAERRGWVGKRTAGVTPGPSEDLLCEMCSESVEGAHHPECMYHVDQARTFVHAQSKRTPLDIPPAELNTLATEAFKEAAQAVASPQEVQEACAQVAIRRAIREDGYYKDALDDDALSDTGKRDVLAVIEASRSTAREIATSIRALIPPSPAQSSWQPRLAEQLADVVMMLDAPDAYNREYIAAVCRSILSSVASTDCGSGK